MSTNERENRRSEKKAKKQAAAKKIIWAVLIVVMVALFVMKVFELDFSDIKTKLYQSTGIGTSDSDFSYTLTDSSNVQIFNFGGKIAVLSSSMVTVIDTASADVLYEFSHGYSAPVMKTSGSAALTFDQGAYKFRLDSTTENIYEQTAENSILCADVADNGTAVIATTSDSAKSEITVYSKSLTEKMSYSVSEGYVAAVAISNNGKYLAFTAVTSQNAVFTATVYTMAVNDSEPKASFTYSGTSVIDLHFIKSDLYVVGADFVSIIDSLQSETVVYEQGTLSINAYCYNSNDELIIAYGEYAASSESNIAYIKKNGKIKCEFNTALSVSCVSASASYISVLAGERTATYSASNGEIISTETSSESYSSILMISSRLYGVYHSNIKLLSE
ncbi:MAG: DUF5711 family protein [Clostridiales bacterium]|nr:DUF5711 family protein [Clostridiales bacterium]